MGYTIGFNAFKLYCKKCCNYQILYVVPIIVKYNTKHDLLFPIYPQVLYTQIHSSRNKYLNLRGESKVYVCIRQCWVSVLPDTDCSLLMPELHISSVISWFPIQMAG